MPSQFEENLDKGSFTYPWQYAVENAKLKAMEVAKRLQVCVTMRHAHHMYMFSLTKGPERLGCGGGR